MPTADLTGFTDEQKKAFYNASGLGSGVSVLDNPATISSQTFAPAPTIQLPQYQQQSPQELQGVTTSIPTLDSLVRSLSTPSEAENNANSISQQLLSGLRDLGSRGATVGPDGKIDTTLSVAQKEQNSQLPQQRQQLQDLTGRLTQLRNEALAIPLQIQQEATGRGVTAGGVEPIQNARLRTNAIQSLTLAAQAEALQGNINLAEQQIKRAVELEFAPEQAKINYLKAAYDVNKDILNRQDSKRTKALEIALNERQRLLTSQKEDAVAVRNIANTAAKFGADQSTIQKIIDSGDPDKAIQLAGQHLRDPKDALELEKMRAEISKIKTDTYYTRLKAEAELNPGSVVTDGTIDSVARLLGNNKVGATTKTLVGTIFGVQNAIEDMANNAIANRGGKFPGISPLNSALDSIVPTSIREATRSQSGTESIGYINGINLKIQQWASGAALTEAQTKQVAEMTPTKYDTDEKVKQKLNNLYNFMQQQIKGSLQSEGINYEPLKIDLFAPKTLEGIFK